MIDLHIHSIYSDGSDKVDELVEKAKNFSMFSITDHNNIFASKLIRADNYVTGAEFSVNGSDFALPNSIEIHFVVYNYDSNDQKLNRLVQEYNYYNNLIYTKIFLDILIHHKLPLNLQPIENLISKNVTLNKVHLSKIFVDMGLAKDVVESYKRYVKDFCHTRHYYCNFKKLLDAVKGCGGYMLLAHPHVYGFDNNELDKLLSKTIREGIDGLELVEGHEMQTLEYVRKHNLLYSIGSDYHGANLPKCNKLGVDDTKYIDDDKYIYNLIKKV